MLVPSRCLRTCVVLLSGREAAALNATSPRGVESTAAALHSGNKATVAWETFGAQGKTNSVGDGNAV